MFLTKLPTYTDLVRASNVRVDAEPGKRRLLESFEEIRQKSVSMSVTSTNLHSVFFSTFFSNPTNGLLNDLSPCVFFLAANASMKARIPLSK